jgi:translation initiation factor 2B subunit (eIF-2B alpha/beta/delta family)
VTAAAQAGTDRAADLARLLAITQQLRRDFEREDWARAAELEAERRGLIERVFDDRPTAAELPGLTATLREVVRLNDELIGLAEHRRRTIGRRLDTVAIGTRAKSAYGTVGTPGRGPHL